MFSLKYIIYLASKDKIYFGSSQSPLQLQCELVLQIVPITYKTTGKLHLRGNIKSNFIKSLMLII